MHMPQAGEEGLNRNETDTQLEYNGGTSILSRIDGDK